MFPLVKLSLRNASVLLLVAIIVAVAGILAARSLKQELLPDIKFPVITVITPFPLASPEVVDAQVSRPLSSAVQGLPGLQSVTATSNANVSVLALEFDFRSDLKDAESRTQAAVTRVRSSLPQGVQDPTVAAVRFSDSAVLTLSLSKAGKAEALRQLADQKVIPDLQAIPGVSRIDLTGAPQAQVRVTLDEAKLARYGLDLNTVSQGIKASTLSLPAGAVTDRSLNVPVRVDAVTQTLANLAGVVVGVTPDLAGGLAPATAVATAPNFAAAPAGPSTLPGPGAAFGAGRPPTGFGGSTFTGGSTPGVTARPTASSTVKLKPVLLTDVASIALTVAPAMSFTRTNGLTSIGLAVFKTQEANTLAVVDAVKRKLDSIKAATASEVTVLNDQGKPIAEGVTGLVREGALGGVFAVLVVLFFLGNLRSTLVTALSIPLSLLVALLLLQLQGLTLNVLTLGGLSIAIGRVIDDAIVVVENVYRRLGAGDSPLQAALNGAREVSVPVTASTITTVAVFLPLAFVGGLAGEFFRPLALAVTWAILASLIVAFTIVPLLSSLFIVRAPSNKNGQSALERLYRPTITWVTGHKTMTIVSAVVLLVASGLLATRLPTNFVTGGTPTTVNGTLKLPDGALLATSNAESLKVESRLADLRAKNVVATYQAVVGGADNPFALAFGAGTGAAVSFTVAPAAGVSIEALQARLEKDLNGVTSGPLTWQSGTGGGGFSNSVDIKVQADDPLALQQASQAVLAAVSGVSKVKNARSSLAAVKQEFAVRVDQQKAYRAGVIPATVAGRIREALQGSTAATININERPVDVLVAYPSAAYRTLDDLNRLTLKPSFGGAPVTLASIASVQAVPGPTSITRLDGNRTVTVSADPRTEDIGSASAAVKEAVSKLRLPTGATWKVSGVSSSQAESFKSLGVAILAAIALVYVIMVATFGSLITPLLLLVSIPLVAIGVFPLLAIFAVPIGLPVFFGLLLLVGIVVTNAIVMIDLVEHLRNEGMDARQAVIEGASRRVRPIVMTALTTILGLAPLAAGFAEGGAIVGKPLAVTVIGGLASSTFLTLVVVPALYLAVDQLARRGGAQTRRREQLEAPRV